jgi:anti-sigma-K factor RskA
MFVSSTGVVFIGANLPKLDNGKSYELWVIPASGKPAPAGTFDGQGGTSAFYVYTGSTAGASAIAVTLEPEGGSEQPTTTPFIVSKL